MRRPTATTVSAEITMLPASSASRLMACSVTSHLVRASRIASVRGNSPFSGVSSMVVGRR